MDVAGPRALRTLPADAAPPEPEPPLPLLELPAPFLRSVLLCLWEDPGDLASLSCACSQAAALCNDNLLWRELVLKRYGPAVLPGLPPTPEHTRPQQLRGWLFYQGLDGSREGGDDSTLVQEGGHAKTPAQLAEACQSAGAEAFTTCGKLINYLDTPQPAWRRTSFHPAAGMYVRQAVAEYRSLALPDAAGSDGGAPSRDGGGGDAHPAAGADVDGGLRRRRGGGGSTQAQQQQGQGGHEPDAPGQQDVGQGDSGLAAPTTTWPPQSPGWVYYPSVTCPGYFLEEPPASLAAHASLAALLAASLARPKVVAVTTLGETKEGLRPPFAWRVDPSYDVGLYVKESVVQQLRLPPPAAAPDYRALAAKLHRLRLPASSMDACWLDDQHLQLLLARDAPADGDGVVLLVHNVWWLEINGSISGVLPGSYQVVWWVDFINSAGYGAGPTYELSATAAAKDAADGGDTGGAIATAGATTSASVTTSSSVMAKYTQDQVLRDMAAHGVTRGASWFPLSGGVLHVRSVSTVHLRCWSHEDWKGNIRFAYAELVPAGQGAAGGGASGRRRQQMQRAGRQGQGGGWWAGSNFLPGCRPS